MRPTLQHWTRAKPLILREIRGRRQVILSNVTMPFVVVPRPPVWFALDESRPLAFFAGLWTRWRSVRKVKEGETTNDLFGFLTTEPNAEVKAIHPKAMPVILTTQAEVETWLTAPAGDALALQKPLPDGALKIVARGDRTGDAAEG